MDDFLYYAIAAGLLVAWVCGPLGCLVVWRRMAYFGDALSHTALLGVALGLLYQTSLNLSVLIVCSVFALLLVWLQQKKILATDTLLGILAHAALSIGMIAISFVRGPRLDLHSLLFGDLLAVTPSELMTSFVGAVVVSLLLMRFWQPLVLMTLHENLARVEGHATTRLHVLLLILMTIVVALSLRVVGVLLITAMLIIPAASARLLADSPEKMAFFAIIIGSLSVVIGILISGYTDSPSGPTIVCVAVSIFILMQLFAFKRVQYR